MVMLVSFPLCTMNYISVVCVGKQISLASPACAKSFVSRTRFHPIAQEKESCIGWVLPREWNNTKKTFARGIVNVTGWPHREVILASASMTLVINIAHALALSSLQVPVALFQDIAYCYSLERMATGTVHNTIVPIDSVQDFLSSALPFIFQLLPWI